MTAPEDDQTVPPDEKKARRKAFVSGLPVQRALASLFADAGRQAGKGNRYNAGAYQTRLQSDSTAFVVRSREEKYVEDAAGVKHPLDLNLFDGLDGVVALRDHYYVVKNVDFVVYSPRGELLVQETFPDGMGPEDVHLCGDTILVNYHTIDDRTDATVHLLRFELGKGFTARCNVAAPPAPRPRLATPTKAPVEPPQKPFAKTLEDAVALLEKARKHARTPEVLAAARELRTAAAAAQPFGELTDRLLALVQKFEHEPLKADVVTALYLVLLRAGDHERLLKVAAVQPTYLAQNPIVWALNEGAASPVAYAAVLGLADSLQRLVAPRRAEGLLAAHVHNRPQLLPRVLEVISARAPHLALRFLLQVVWDPAWPGDPAPAVPVILEAIGAERSTPRERRWSEAAVLRIGREQPVDLSAVRPLLEATLPSPARGVAAGWLLGRHELSRAPVDWKAVDALRRHPAAPARIGVLRALAHTWLRRDELEVPPRLVAALDDGDPAVRDEVRVLLVDGLRRSRPFGELDAQIDGLLGHTGCRLCRYLLPEDWWGEQKGDGDIPWIDREPPPELSGLERQGEDVYRCPGCGAMFDKKEGGGEWLNNEWTYWWLERRRS